MAQTTPVPMLIRHCICLPTQADFYRLKQNDHQLYVFLMRFARCGSDSSSYLPAKHLLATAMISFLRLSTLAPLQPHCGDDTAAQGLQKV